MSELRIIRGNTVKTVTFRGTPLLDEVLEAAGMLQPHPCGGRGSCGKCAVTLTGNVSEPTPAERKAGTRLSCQAVLLGDAQVRLSDDRETVQIETGNDTLAIQLNPVAGRIAAAVDIGTTTLAVKVYDLENGRVLGTAAELNPQTAVAADVMGRIDAAMKGKLSLMEHQITETLERLLGEAAGEKTVDTAVITGNTTMLYLLTGRNPEPLSHAPFEADTLFGTDWKLDCLPVYLPPCMNAFVGADITCAVLASGMWDREETGLLCDIGTNGEIALYHHGKLYVTSTAAGPAFEGAGISCGCGSVPGAIDRVWLENGSLAVHTIGEQEAVGICGSGLIDAVAAALEAELVDETGALDEDELELSPGVCLQPRDIRAVQLAKAAIAAGIQVLLETAGVGLEEVDRLYIAGGFGSHLNTESAAKIGLLPEQLLDRTVVLGNGAIAGAAMALLNRDNRQILTKIAAESVHVNLGGNPSFNEKYVEHMFFGEDE